MFGLGFRVSVRVRLTHGFRMAAIGFWMSSQVRGCGRVTVRVRVRVTVRLG